MNEITIPIETIMDILEDLDGRGIIFVDEELVREYLKDATYTVTVKDE